MSIASQIERLQEVRNEMRDVLINWGIITEVTADFDDMLTELAAVVVNGTVNVILDIAHPSAAVIPGLYKGGEVKIDPQEKTVTTNGEVIPDSGKVLSKVVVSVDNTPILQDKSVTPTKSPQTINPDTGFDGLLKVIVNAIPDAYQNVSNVSAGAGDVLAGKIIVDSTGKEIAGAMVENGAVAATIDGLNVTEYIIPGGHHSGIGKVSLTNDIENALASL